MPNNLDATGLTVATQPEIVAAISAALQAPAVYGADINLNPNTPDGQLVNIFAQAVADMLETLLDVYNILFVDSAYGTTLDNLVALNGLARQAGSYTQNYVEVTVTQALTLPGLDQPNPFTVADDAGNQYQLVESYAFGAAGTATLLFRAALLGQVQVVPNTITTIVATTNGVTAVNNPAFTVTTTGAVLSGMATVTGIATTAGMRPGMAVTSSAFPVGTTVASVDSSSQITCSQNATTSATVSLTVATPPTITGLPEENDVQLKIRRAKSFYLQTVGPSDALRAALLALPDVADAYVAENDTDSTVNGVPAHGIWTIVNGGTGPEIGAAIYAKKMPGCAQKGSQTQVVARPAGNTFTAKWDLALTERLYAKATLNPKIPGLTFDLVTDAAALAAALTYKLGQNPCIGDIVQALAVIEPNAVLSDVAVSLDGSSWVDIVEPSDFQHFFTLAAGDVTLSEA